MTREGDHVKKLVYRFRIRLINWRFDRCDAARVAMYTALRAGQRRPALRAARKAARLARLTGQTQEQVRYNRWLDALQSGRRIKFSTFPVTIRTRSDDPPIETMFEIDQIERDLEAKAKEQT
jgi:hypothetical protein